LKEYSILEYRVPHYFLRLNLM